MTRFQILLEVCQWYSSWHAGPSIGRLEVWRFTLGLCVTWCCLPRKGQNPLSSLSRDIWSHRVWFSVGFVLNRISSFVVLNKVFLHNLTYMSLRFRAPWIVSPEKCGVSMMLCALTKHAAIFGSLWLQLPNIPKRDLYSRPSRPWKDNRSNYYCGNVRKMLSLSINGGCRGNENCLTRNVRKICRLL